jgi:Putative peptidoglycan binding domain.
LVELQHRKSYRSGRASALLVGIALALTPVAAHAQVARDSGYGKRTLRAGMHGGDVSALQGYLDAAGYTTISNGRFDRSTGHSVVAFKADNGLRRNAIVDPGTAREIRAVATAPPLPGGMAYGQKPASSVLPLTSGQKARVLSNGMAAAPRDAPAEVKAIIAQGNKIAQLPYKWGGGHGGWNDTGYDCSGSTTFALRTTFRKGHFPTFGYSNWQQPGPGRWVTTYASSSHVYLVVAGIRFDTSGLRQTGSRWQRDMRSNDGFVLRHPTGF